MDPQNQSYMPPVSPVPPTQMYPPPPPPPKPRRTGLIIGIVIGALIIILLGVVIFMLMPTSIRDNADMLRDRAAQGQQTADQVRNQIPADNTTAPPAQTGPATGASATAPAQSVPSSSLPIFAGEWNGSYASSPLVGTACKASGAVSFSIQSNGSITGYVVIKDRNVPGTGTIDSNGNLNGVWNYTGGNLTWTGKINAQTNTGSGTYRNALGCFGTFSINK